MNCVLWCVFLLCFIKCICLTLYKSSYCFSLSVIDAIFLCISLEIVYHSFYSFLAFFLLKTFTELSISKSQMIQRSIICKTQKITDHCNLSDLTDRNNTGLWTTENKFGVWFIICFQFLLQVCDFSRYVMSFKYLCISTELNIDFILTHTPNVNNHFIIILLPFL